MDRAILVVEDDPEHGAILKLALSAIKGLSFHLAGSFSEALDFISSGRRPAILLIDIGVPDRNGIDCAQILRGFYGPDNPYLVVITAYVRPGELINYSAAYPFRVIQKPFAISELMATIDELVAQLP